MSTTPSPLPDVTAIFIPLGEHDPASVRRAILAGGYGDVYLRARPLGTVGLLQIELYDSNGIPRLDAALVSVLSERGSAAFVHRNSGAGQALFHHFARGRESGNLWQGKPEELDEKVQAVLGHTASAIALADDGSRVHPAFAASSTIALVRGRPLAVPVGTPLQLGTFSFHDRNAQSAAEASDKSDRVALIAFDVEAVRSSWQTVTGLDLAERIKGLPEHVVGPLAAAREEAIRDLTALGEETPEAAGLMSIRAMELVALSESFLFGGGEAVSYLDERVLPMFSLASHEPPLDDPDEAEELESRESVLAAMVEVLPYRSPEGAVMENLEDSEVRPLAPWAKPGEEYVGTMLAIHGDRLRGLLGGVDQRDVAGWVDRFYRGWWKAQTDDPWGEEFEKWRTRLDEKGGADVQRFLVDWAEWRTVLELAHVNQLQPALVFYG